ncbi:unnamed protein product [Darwinula stevensoni]|uniref:Uncharacterized protein n=1 Tax=Darwinula stevensoni TaxID=69355 RepID=A0A7R8XCU4_9CRUS|nr:unnamed protein product [Darwinula stevensoni]CAG0892338.1 unnamed protein product [Darwinula stevensoni]
MQRLNGLNVDEDLVKRNDSRLIPGRTRFLNPVDVGDLAVRGWVDGVRLEDFLETLVTTEFDRKVAGRWEFLDDVIVSGKIVTPSINGIKMEEIVTRSGTHKIKGRKVIKGDVTVKGSVAVGKINGKNIRELSEIILMKDRPQEICCTATFKGPVTGGGINMNVIGTANGYDVSTFPRRLESWVRDSMGRVEALGRGLKGVQDKYFEYLRRGWGGEEELAYFVEHGVLEVGSVTHFIGVRFGGDEGIYCIYAVPCKSAKGSCQCYETRVLVMDRDGGLKTSGSPKPHRYFPFVAPAQDGAFLLYSDSYADRPGCASPEAQLMIQSLSLRGGLTLDTEGEGLLGTVTLQGYPMGFLSDVEYFTHDRRLYMVVCSYYDRRLESTNLKAILYSYDELKGEWVEIQWIPTHGAKAMALVHHRYGIDLVICNAFDSVKRSATTKSIIFRFLPREEKFVLIREVTTEHASDVVGMMSASGKVLVAIAQEKGDVVGGGGKMERNSARVVVLAYSGEKGQYFVVQNVPEYGVTGLASFALHGRTYLVTSSPHFNRIGIYQYKGASGFRLVQRIPFKGVGKVHAYRKEGVGMFVVGSSAGRSRVFRARVWGRGEGRG